jgi:uncharacterized membrane protein
LWFKALHILAVTIFLGNIITGLFWKIHAEQTRDPRIIAHTFEGIIRSDAWFTRPGVMVLVILGLFAAVNAHWPLLSTGWILWAIVLISISGLCFMFFIAPLQRKIAALARSATSQADMDWAQYHKLERSWSFWGTIAVLTPIGALAIMVLKPALPAF